MQEKQTQLRNQLSVESERESVCPSPKQAKDPNLFQGRYVGPKAQKEKMRIERRIRH